MIGARNNDDVNDAAQQPPSTYSHHAADWQSPTVKQLMCVAADPPARARGARHPRVRGALRLPMWCSIRGPVCPVNEAQPDAELPLT